jgi:hypothetical protein
MGLNDLNDAWARHEYYLSRLRKDPEKGARKKEENGTATQKQSGQTMVDDWFGGADLDKKTPGSDACVGSIPGLTKDMLMGMGLWQVRQLDERSSAVFSQQLLDALIESPLPVQENGHIAPVEPPATAATTVAGSVVSPLCMLRHSLRLFRACGDSEASVQLLLWLASHAAPSAMARVLLPMLDEEAMAPGGLFVLTGTVAALAAALVHRHWHWHWHWEEVDGAGSHCHDDRPAVASFYARLCYMHKLDRGSIATHTDTASSTASATQATPKAIIATSQLLERLTVPDSYGQALAALAGDGALQSRSLAATKPSPGIGCGTGAWAGLTNGTKGVATVAPVSSPLSTEEQIREIFASAAAGESAALSAPPMKGLLYWVAGQTVVTGSPDGNDADSPRGQAVARLVGIVTEGGGAAGLAQLLSQMLSVCTECLANAMAAKQAARAKCVEGDENPLVGVPPGAYRAVELLHTVVATLQLQAPTALGGLDSSSSSSSAICKWLSRSALRDIAQASDSDSDWCRQRSGGASTQASSHPVRVRGLVMVLKALVARGLLQLPQVLQQVLLPPLLTSPPTPAADAQQQEVLAHLEVLLLLLRTPDVHNACSSSATNPMGWVLELEVDPLALSLAQSSRSAWGGVNRDGVMELLVQLHSIAFPTPQGEDGKQPKHRLASALLISLCTNSQIRALLLRSRAWVLQWLMRSVVTAAAPGAPAEQKGSGRIWAPRHLLQVLLLGSTAIDAAAVDTGPGRVAVEKLLQRSTLWGVGSASGAAARTQPADNASSGMGFDWVELMLLLRETEQRQESSPPTEGAQDFRAVVCECIVRHLCVEADSGTATICRAMAMAQRVVEQEDWRQEEAATKTRGGQKPLLLLVPLLRAAVALLDADIGHVLQAAQAQSEMKPSAGGGFRTVDHATILTLLHPCVQALLAAAAAEEGQGVAGKGEGGKSVLAALADELIVSLGAQLERIVLVCATINLSEGGQCAGDIDYDSDDDSDDNADERMEGAMHHEDMREHALEAIQLRLSLLVPLIQSRQRRELAGLANGNGSDAPRAGTVLGRQGSQPKVNGHGTKWLTAIARSFACLLAQPLVRAQSMRARQREAKSTDEDESDDDEWLAQHAHRDCDDADNDDNDDYDDDDDDVFGDIVKAEGRCCHDALRTSRYGRYGSGKRSRSSHPLIECCGDTFRTLCSAAYLLELSLSDELTNALAAVLGGGSSADSADSADSDTGSAGGVSQYRCALHAFRCIPAADSDTLTRAHSYPLPANYSAKHPSSTPAGSGVGSAVSAPAASGASQSGQQSGQQQQGQQQQQTIRTGGLSKLFIDPWMMLEHVPDTPAEEALHALAGTATVPKRQRLW